MLTNVLTPAEAIAGFSSNAVITIAALFVVGGAVLQTGLAGMIGRRILAIAGTNETRLIVVIMVAIGLLSGVMSNTGAVAVLLPAIISLARSAGISASKLLIPLAFGSSLGGAMTLIGTPPNIIVSDELRNQGLAPFEFFDFTPVGIVVLVAGIGFMLFVGKRLLPEHRPEEVERFTSPEELMELYHIAEKLFSLRVRSKSHLIDKSLANARFRRDYGLTVVEILRSPQPVSVASFGDQKLVLQSNASDRIFPTAETVIQQDDILIVQGIEADVENAIEACTLELQPNPDNEVEALVDRQHGIAEVVLPPRSSLIGKTLRETRFAPSYNLSVLDISRPGSDRLDLNTTRLEFGDTLIVQGMWHNIISLKKRRQDFVVLGQPETMVDATNSQKAPIAAVIFFAMLGILAFDLLPLTTASLLAALAIALTGCLSADEFYDAIDWKSIILIGGMLPMATALEKVGLVDEIVAQVTLTLGDSSPYIMMAGFFLLTAIFTQVLSNTATAVLLAPIAFATALEIGVSPEPLLMTVAISASMAFASPVASPVNTLVMGAGKYSFMDYVKIGTPMILLMFVLSMITIPIFFPF
jgi:di/tricarboxylate transporter